MKNKNLIFKTAFLFIFLLLSFTLINAQDDEPTYRKVTSKDFKKTSKSTASTAVKVYKSSISRRRPPRQSRRKSTTGTSKRKKPVKKTNKPIIKKPVWEELGFTLWKLRKKSANETNSSLQIWESGVRVDYVPERIESTTELSKGDKIRITIESPQEGYLYIFDREKLSDGTYGEPYLIFPTKRTRDGNNSVEAGRLIDIPAQEDDPPIFVIDSDNPYYAGEILSVIVSEDPINEIPTPGDTIRFSISKFNDWLKNWGVDAEVYEMDGGKGLAWTPAEKDASNGKLERSLSQGEPSPQTVYRFQTKPDTPIMVNFAITVKSNP